jgi:hypothetical protein
MARATSLTQALNSINSELETLRLKKVEAILRPLQRERAKLQARIGQIDRLVEGALGKATSRNAAPAVLTPKPLGKRKRIRRSGDALKKIATSVVEFIKSKGSAGVTPAEIKAAFGQLFPSPLQFVKKHAGVQLRRKGHAKRPRYFHG